MKRKRLFYTQVRSCGSAVPVREKVNCTCTGTTRGELEVEQKRTNKKKKKNTQQHTRDVWTEETTPANRYFLIGQPARSRTDSHLLTSEKGRRKEDGGRRRGEGKGRVRKGDRRTVRRVRRKSAGVKWGAGEGGGEMCGILIVLLLQNKH